MRWVWIGGALVLIALVIVAISIGTIVIAPVDVISALRGEGDPTLVTIVRDLRAPRVLLAALVGAGLSMSGGALQGTLRNVLAEPYLLGVSGGAAVGAVVAMALGVGTPTLLTLSAFGGAAVATLLVSAIARVVGGRTDTRLLLMAGVVVGAFANAAILVALADAPPERLRGALWWMMGSAADATWSAVARLAILVLALGALLVWWARELDVLSMGDESAAALGVDVERATRRVFLVASWLAAATVAAAGLVGFVGLVVPNIARALGARRHRGMLLLSALCGASLLVAADLFARTLRSPADLPLGAVTALVGVPLPRAPETVGRMTTLGSDPHVTGFKAPSLLFDQVTVRYPGRAAPAVKAVTLAAPPRQVTAVVGPNGSGKSTLVRALLRLAPVSSGDIRLDTEPVTALNPRTFATRVAVVPQREEPTVPMLVHDFVALGRHAHRSAFGALRAEDRRCIDQALVRAGMEDAISRRTDQLSGGEWQRVRIAGALAQDAPVIVLDEPTSFLDIAHEMAVFELLDSLAREGRTVLLVSHRQLNLVARFAAHIVLLHEGSVGAAGSPSDVMQGELLERVYEWPLVVTRDAAVGAPALLPLRRGSRR